MAKKLVLAVIDSLKPEQLDRAVAAARAAFESTWVRWNVVRAVCSTAAFGCLVGALAVR